MFILHLMHWLPIEQIPFQKLPYTVPKVLLLIPLPTDRPPFHAHTILTLCSHLIGPTDAAACDQ